MLAKSDFIPAIFSSTAFIGRENDLARMEDIIFKQQSHILTLLGTGGTGKTRLAAEFGLRNGDRFMDGAFFVPLQGVGDASLIPSVIADIIGIPATIQDEPFDMLKTYLADKHILLILDNFEHLLDGASLVATLVASNARLCVVLTSRESLNISNEWVYSLEGLRYPTFEDDAISEYDAVQLFEKRAIQARHDFEIAQNPDAVVRICTLVQGIPLALELAASWLNILTCEEIADEIQKNIDFLATTRRDMPERHRSIRAVFNQAWTGLTEPEKRTLTRLSVFRGGFTLDAAREVALASLPVLSSLLNKALLWRSDVENGRYSIHELLRQYIEEQIIPDEYESLHDGHAGYFKQFLLQYDTLQLNPSTTVSGPEMIDATYIELDNILFAWNRIMMTAPPLEAQTVLRALSNAFQARARYFDARALFEDTVQLLTPIAEEQPDRIPVLSQALTVQGWASIRLSMLNEAREVLEVAQEVAETVTDQSTVYIGQGASRTSGLSLTYYALGHYKNSVHCARRSLEQSIEAGRAVSIAIAQRGIGRGLVALGEYEEAHKMLVETKETTEANDGFWFKRHRAYVLLELARVSYILGNEIATSAYFAEAQTVAEIEQDNEWLATSLFYQGEIALKKREFEHARDTFAESLRQYQLFGDRHNITRGSAKLAMAHIGIGDYNSAKQCILHGLDIAIAMHFIPGLLQCLTAVVELMVGVRMNLDLSKYLLNLVENHPNISHETREYAQGISAHSAELLAEITYNEAFSVAELTSLAALSQKVLRAHDLPDSPTVANNLPRTTHEMQVVANDALIEPLSERELEVLTLLADGLTNQEIGGKLFLATGTVKAHNHNIFTKLGVRNRVKAIARAQELGLLT